MHGVDAVGQVVIRRQLKRRYVLPFFQKLPPCLVGIEACASSHYWSRELEVRVHLNGSGDAIRTILAKHIIAMAEQGERDRHRLIVN